MIQSDISILRERFSTQFPPHSAQIGWEGKAAADVDETKPYCFFRVELGACEAAWSGVSLTYQQLGHISLSVTVPKTSPLSTAYDLIEKFDALFRGWRSADGLLEIKGSTHSPVRETETSYEVRIRFQWQSFRRKD